MDVEVFTNRTQASYDAHFARVDEWFKAVFSAHGAMSADGEFVLSSDTYVGKEFLIPRLPAQVCCLQYVNGFLVKNALQVAMHEPATLQGRILPEICLQMQDYRYELELSR